MRRPQTMMDVYRILPEGTPLQLINNRFYMSPSPNYQHFDVLDSIVDALKSETKNQKNGRIFFAPVDVFLGTKTAVQPDVFFIAKERVSIIKEDGVHGAPDLIVEVLSPGNKNADLVKKKSVYEKSGVKEYFVVEPSDKTVISFYLVDGKYAEQKKQKGKLVSKMFKKTFVF